MITDLGRYSIIREICQRAKTYLRYSDGGTSFLSKETMTIVEVKLSSTELRKKVIKPTCNSKIKSNKVDNILIGQVVQHTRHTKSNQ